MKKTLRNLLLFALLVLCNSHELFLRSESHFLKSNSAYELFLVNGTFDQSENAITTDRIVFPKILGPNFEMVPTTDAFSYRDDKTYLTMVTGEAGTYVAGISTLPRVLEMTSVAFNDYLDHEGLDRTIALRKEQGETGMSAKERYSKHVKALLQVDDRRSDHFKTRLGYPIEFVPLENPFDKKVGEPISFLLLRDGKPLADQTVHYSTSVPGEDAHEGEKSVKTDADGVCTIIPDQAGPWYVATIHMLKSGEAEVDYESNWATLTFAVR
ncbi:DUF4198 domain-containing protein [Flavobacteriaceae bacterium TP-CH-4]|uniref:DUF4198 domain-containing protein n=1 Tax=Pelagihabitans pacificus TaxID=2696054 RepID=A0A967APT4_9FLAO|nr:DUF4198 domain-containing protein [Pelagihabitans pacificus]NHF57787.1 DUF4198 domain-containing protein [Pelagihabitans pacificus]